MGGYLIVLDQMAQLGRATLISLCFSCCLQNLALLRNFLLPLP